MISVTKYLFVFFWLALPTLCTANSVSLTGVGSTIDIKRSVVGHWASMTGIDLSAENTLAAPHKIIIQGALLNPPAWHGRYLRVSVNIPVIWLLDSPAAQSFLVELITDGSANPPADFITDLDQGNYLAAPLTIESRADTDAIPGAASLDITFTIISQI